MQNAGITINDILVAILGAAGLPWESLPVQGLQPYSATLSEASYQVGLTADCSVLSSGFAVTVHLPSGFFPDSSTPTVAGTTPSARNCSSTVPWRSLR